MDRPYSSKTRKSQGRITVNSEASEKLKALFPEQSDTRLVSPFVQNVVKSNGEATECKASVTEAIASCDNTCVRVNSLPKIIITAADDKKSDTDLTTTTVTDKKCSKPLIKAPLLPNTRLQVPLRIQSASVRRPPISKPIVKAVSTTTLAVRPRPVGGNEKPNTIWHSGKPIAVSSGNLSSDGAETKKKQTPAGNSVPANPTAVAKKRAETCQVISTLGDIEAEQTSTNKLTAIEDYTESQTASTDETNKSDIKQETPSQEKISTNDTTLFNLRDPTESVNEETAASERKLTSEEMHMTEKVLAQFPSVLQRIRTARSRGAVIPPPDYDAEDSDDEYEEDTDSSSEESDRDKQQQEHSAEPSSIKCISETDTDNLHNVNQQRSSSQSSSESIEEVYEPNADKHEISSQQKSDAASVQRCSTENTVVCKSISGGELNGITYPPCVIPRYQRRSSFPQLATKFKGLPQAFSMPSLINEPPKSPVSKHKHDSEVQQHATSASPAITVTAEEEKEATLSLLHAMTYQLKVMAGRCSPSDYLPTQTELSAAMQPQGMLKRRREQTKSQLRNNLASRYAFTPLKMIVGELLVLHHDVMPTEICPTLNRSPSFVGEYNGNDDDGLLSGRSSPKLDIPRRRYCGRMIHQHPLAKYIYRMKKPIRRFRDVYKKAPSTDCSDEDDGGSCPAVEVFTPDQLAAKFGHNVRIKEDDASLTKKEKETEMPKQNSYVQLYAKKASHEKTVKQSVPFLKPTSYLEMYKKRATAKSSSLTTTPYKGSLNRGIQFSKKSVLPPIGVAPEQHQQQVGFVPKPPLDKPATSGQFASLRKFRVKQLQNKRPQETSKVAPAPLTVDTTGKRKEHAQKMEKMKRKQEYSESIRKKQKPATWTEKKQQYARSQP